MQLKFFFFYELFKYPVHIFISDIFYHAARRPWQSITFWNSFQRVLSKKVQNSLLFFFFSMTEHFVRRNCSSTQLANEIATVLVMLCCHSQPFPIIHKWRLHHNAFVSLNFKGEQRVVFGLMDDYKGALVQQFDIFFKYLFPKRKRFSVLITRMEFLKDVSTSESSSTINQESHFKMWQGKGKHTELITVIFFNL